MDKKSELQLLNLIWENSVEGMVLSDQEGKVVKVNRKYLEIYGYNEAEILNNSFAVIFPPEARKNAIAEYKKLFPDKNPPSAFQTEILRKDGSKRMIDSRIDFIFEDNQKKLMLSIIRDITGQHQMETKLKENEANLQAMFNSTLQMFIMIDADFKILSLNEVAKKYYKKVLDIDVNQGQNIIELLYPEHIDEFKSNFKKAFDGEKIQTERSIPVDGGSMYFRFNYLPVFEDDEKINKIIFTVLDITKEKASHLEVQESEKKFKTIINSINQMVSFTTSDLKYGFVNDAYVDFFMLTREEIEGRKVVDIIGEPVFKKAKRHIDVALSGEFVQYFEHFKYPNQKEKYIDGKLIPYRDKQNKVTGYFAILNDITDYISMSNELVETQQHHIDFLNSLPQYVFEIDTESCVTFLNDYAMNMLKLTQSEINERKIFARDIIIHDDLPKLYNSLAQNLDGTKFDGNEYRSYVNGELRILQIYNTPILKHGNIIGLRGIAVDITERKNNEKALLVSENRYKMLVETMKSGVAIYKPFDNGYDYEIIGYNQAAERITGVSKKEIHGKSILEVFPDIINSPLYVALRQVFTTGKEKHLKPYSQKFKNKQGWWENFIYKLETGEIVAIFSDVTDQKESEIKLLQQNEELKFSKLKAEESDQLKTAFLNNISHEFRTPMNGILGFTDYISELKDDDEEFNQFQHVIHESCDQLLSILTDTIEISQVQSKTMPLEISDCNPVYIIESAIEDFRSIIENKKLDFKLELGCNKEVIIKSDAQKLSKIILHLLDNAIKFTPEGSIKVTCAQAEGKRINISVEDTGIGIASEMHEEIFKAFRQVEIGIVRKFGGNGVGLALVKAYTEMLDGEIILKSKPGEGTSITISLPITEVMEVSKRDEKKQDVNLAGKTFLLVDDESFNLDYLEEIISREKSKYYTAVNGRGAIDIFKEHPDIDMVLMDLKMPEIDGYEATSEILAINSKIPVIAQTAYAGMDDIIKIKESGFTDYIVKPIKRKDLLKIIKKHLD